MSPHQTIALAVRLFAIWLAIYVARAMPAFYVAGVRQGAPHSLLIAVAISVLGVVCVLVLWFFPKTVARQLLPLSSDVPAPPASPDLWLSVGCALLGLWVMTSAIPALVRYLLLWYIARSYEMDKTFLRDGLIHSSAEFVVGAWLIFGMSGIKKLIWWARNAGSN